jgi:hypothetical protein
MLANREHNTVIFDGGIAENIHTGLKLPVGKLSASALTRCCRNW